MKTKAFDEEVASCRVVVSCLSCRVVARAAPRRASPRLLWCGLLGLAVLCCCSTVLKSFKKGQRKEIIRIVRYCFGVIMAEGLIDQRVEYVVESARSLCKVEVGGEEKVDAFATLRVSAAVDKFLNDTR